MEFPLVSEGVQPPVVSAVCVAVALILQQLFAFLVSAKRGRLNVGSGDGGDADLARLIRRHGNFTEASSIFLIALMISEMLGLSTLIIVSAAVVFVVSRLLHAIGFAFQSVSHMTSPGPLVMFRMAGSMGTYFVSMALGIYLLLTLTGRL